MVISGSLARLGNSLSNIYSEDIENVIDNDSIKKPIAWWTYQNKNIESVATTTKKIITDIQTGLDKIRTESKSPIFPSLSEVAFLFDEFYSFAKHYPWGDKKAYLERVFMKILAEYIGNYEALVDRKKLRNFLQLNVYIYSETKENLTTVNHLKKFETIVHNLLGKKVDKEHNIGRKGQAIQVKKENKEGPTPTSSNESNLDYQPNGNASFRTKEQELILKPGKTHNTLNLNSSIFHPHLNLLPIINTSQNTSKFDTKKGKSVTLFVEILLFILYFIFRIHTRYKQE